MCCVCDCDLGALYEVVCVVAATLQKVIANQPNQ